MASTIMPVVLSTIDAATYLGLSPKTLENWRTLHYGPRYARLGGDGRPRIVYRISDLDRWLEDQTVDPGTEADAASHPGAA